MNPQLLKSIIQAKDQLPTGQAMADGNAELNGNNQMAENPAQQTRGGLGTAMAVYNISKNVSDIAVSEAFYQSNMDAVRSGNIALQLSNTQKERTYNRVTSTISTAIGFAVAGAAVAGPFGAAAGAIIGIGYSVALNAWNDAKTIEQNTLTVHSDNAAASYYKDIGQINFNRR